MSHTFPKIPAACSLALSILLSACGGGGGGGVQKQTGYFIDSAVAGLQYQSGSTSGLTGSDGSFTYEVGQTVTFKIGNVTLGSLSMSKPGNKVFPTDLIANPTDTTNPQNDPNVTLIAQLLQTLDSDNDPSNGITIPEAKSAALGATTVAAVNLSTANAANATTQLNTLVQTLSNGYAGLLTATQARANLQSSILAQYQGGWTTSFSGGDEGSCSMIISLATGSTTPTLTGTCNSSRYGTTYQINGTTNTAGAFTATGTSSSGATFTGTLTKNGSGSGQWTNTGAQLSGSWSATKQ